MAIQIKIINELIAIPPRAEFNAKNNSGAVVEFYGIVRGAEDGKLIDGIEYEAFVEMAEHQLTILAKKYSEEYGLHDCICIHRIGYIPVGEASLYIRFASSHRAEAFAAITEFINDLKKVVPIWKHPQDIGHH